MRHTIRSTATATRIITRSSLGIGVLCALIALLGQFMLVHLCYQGNWSGLFFTGDVFRVPTELAHENIYIFKDSAGYDGQFYHYMAHDPFHRRAFHGSMDAPLVRYQRILVPLLVHLLAGGSDELIDKAYYTVIIIFVFLGGYWLSRIAVLHERHPVYGLAFLLVPSVLVSLERMTVEVALASLTAAFALYATREPSWKLYLVMVAAVLTRETGMFLVGGYLLYCSLNRGWLRAAFFATSTFPGLVWIHMVNRTGLDLAMIVIRGGDQGMRIAGLVRRLCRPIKYVFAGPKLYLVRITDEIAWIGMLAGCIMGIRMAIRKQPGPIELTAALSGAVGLLAGSVGFWFHPVGYCRPFSSLLVLLILRAITDRAWWLIAPVLMIDLRIAVEFGPRLLTMIHNISA